jgi:hypothetical protein
MFYILSAYRSKENCPILGIFNSKEELKEGVDSLVNYVKSTSFIYVETEINAVADSYFGMDWDWAYVDSGTKFEELGWTRWSSNYFPSEHFLNKNLVGIEWDRIK